MHSLIAMAVENLSTPYEDNPINSLVVLSSDQVKSVDTKNNLFKLGPNANILIEGVMEDKSHLPLATVRLINELQVKLESVGRNVHDPNNPANVLGVFLYDFNELKTTAHNYKTKITENIPRWTLRTNPVEMFFARYQYFGLGNNPDALRGIIDLHIIAKLDHDPRIQNQIPSKLYRFRRDYRGLLTKPLG
jgi:hypothetical protein